MNENTRTRTLSIPHLVLGIVFAGIAAIKFIGEATDADVPGSAIGLPVVLIGAGIVGLAATFVNARRRTNAARVPAAEHTPDEHTLDETEQTTTDASDETVVLEEER